jgi:hypothetical protein
MENFAAAATYDKKLKRLVKEDWQALLPDMNPLKGYGPLLFKIYGPLVIMYGCAYSSDSWSYGPAFGICNLMLEYEYVIPANFSMDLTIFGNSVYDGKRLWSIDPPDHKSLYKHAFNAINAVTYGFLEQREFTLQEVIAAFKDFIHKSQGKFIGQELVTLPLLAAWGGDIKQAHELLEWSQEQALTVKGNFAGCGGREGWVANTTKLIQEPEKLRATVNTEKTKLNLLDLKCYELS